LTDLPAGPAAPDTFDVLTVLRQAHDDLDRMAARDAAAYLDLAAKRLRDAPSRHAITLAADRVAAVLSALYQAAPRCSSRPPFDIVAAMTGLTAWGMGIDAPPPGPAAPARPQPRSRSPDPSSDPHH